MSASYEPGVYVKGDSEKVAQSRSDAVALVFDGYKVKSEGAVEAPQEKAAATVTDVPETPEVTEAPKPKAPAPKPPVEKKD